MKLLPTTLPGVHLIEPQVHGDARGFFVEAWNARSYAQVGIDSHFVQSNLSGSQRGVRRGLHFQHPHGQAKLVYVPLGCVFDVAVDVRVGSPSFGHWFGCELSAENRHQLYIPAGFAHGFQVISEHALFAYLCSEVYVREADRVIAHDDPQIAIDWPLPATVISAKDASAPTLSQIDRTHLPIYGAG